MKIMKTAFLLVGLILMPTSVLAVEGDAVLGKWITIDDKTGKQKSIINLYKKGNKLFGKVEKLLAGATATHCEKCQGDNKGKPITCMTVIKNLKFNGKQWQGGTILDPKNGKVYNCKLWHEGDKLKVRGYISFLYRTQVWKRQ